MAKAKGVTMEELLEALGEFYTGHLKPEFQSINSRLDSVEEYLGNLKTEQRFLRDEIKGLKSEISSTPSIKDFNLLKKRVDLLHQPPSR